MHFLMSITLCRRAESIRVPLAYIIATDESRVGVNLLEFLQLLRLYACRKVICSRRKYGTDNIIIGLANLAEPSWIML